MKEKKNNHFAYEVLGEIYETLNYDCDYDKWSQYLLNLLERYGVRAGKGLDLACGNGKMTKIFARSGFDMVGVDISPAMLSAAMENGGRFGIKYICADISEFCEVKNRDFAICTCDGVNYLNPESQFDKFLANTHSQLKKGGIFLFDISTAFKLREILGNNLYADDTDDISYIWQNELFDGYVDMNLIFFIRRGGTYEKKYEEQRLYIYEREFVERRLKAAGFCDTLAFECFTESEGGERSERLQFIAKKA